MGDGAEFDAIRCMLAVWGSQAVAIGDDAAVLSVPEGEKLVVSTDATMENVHFLAEWLGADEIGARATAAALSDLAAMAATPRGLVLALGVPERWREELASIARGVGAVAAAAECPIVGGNITMAGELSLTITVIGSCATPLTRAGAQPGDVIWVTGRLGGPRAAVRALFAGNSVSALHWARFASPVPRLQEGKWLAERGARAGIDISDGLLGDAAHLARASAVSIELDVEAIPCMEGVSGEEALTSGEEYELLVALPPSTAGDVGGEFEAQFGIPLTAIGKAVKRASKPVIVHGAQAYPGMGHDHFA